MTLERDAMTVNPTPSRAPVRPRDHIVVVGTGMAGTRLVQDLVALAPGRHRITMIGAEHHAPYDRIMLSPVLAGDKTPEAIRLLDPDFLSTHAVALHAGDGVAAIDRQTRHVTTGTGRVIGYDRLVLATGSQPIRLPLPGAELDGVVTFRDLGDVDAMLARTRPGAPAVVIGGGLLGLEAAAGLAGRGMAVTVVHLAPTVMERQLDAEAGGLLAAALARRGIALATATQSRAILGDAAGCVSGLELADGRVLPAELLVMAVGIRPETTLARDAGLAVGRGIQVDAGLATSDPHIDALGECVEFDGATFGLVAPLYDQAKVLARRLAGIDGPGFAIRPTATRLKVSGVDVFSAGELGGTDQAAEEIVLRDAGRAAYRKLVIRDDRLVGVVMYGDVADGPWFFETMRKAAPLGEARDRLIFGPAFATMGAAGGGMDAATAAIAALPADAEICGCNGVCKGAITQAISEHGLATIDAVRAHTKASASCGSCTGQVKALIGLTLGDAAPPVTEDADPAICACTSHGHDSLRAAVRDLAPMTAIEAMTALGWTTPEGCAKCRPALNYYLLCAHPGAGIDDPASRFVNERVHANIQKDGSFSVVPRMWGGLTSASELRAIADVVDRYDIPTVKVTGGQRIDLLGVRKQDLPAVWRDLNAAGMVSGHAYAKGLRTVKTCVGSEWCRFGTQDSTGLGVRLERLTWGAWMPHKFKMAVSGCPRNCAEATIKDFGVVCVDSGYELVVGGNGGIHLRGTDALTKVATEDEAIEICLAFIQFYREDARYLERTAPWIERIGIDRVLSVIVEDATGRKALAARFQASQVHARHDPWAALVDRPTAEFTAIDLPARAAAE
ncbi:nitrite reductase large subunit [Tistrella bauzanensis]|uniref:Nitrite reductase large subunit n=2 Tax=Tistrella bauzanensis TaxID=657419 RepID=A0ABQ1I7P0_9PROT|nr:nitrite reductase large subunit [Tistrella bauzanensis]